MTKTCPPGPKENIVRRYFANRAIFFDEMRQQYGPVVHFKIGFFPIYLLTDPADVRQVMTDRGVRKSWLTKLVLSPVVSNGLLLSEGELYAKQRRLIQPAFHRKRISTYGKVAVEACLDWGQKQVDGRLLDLDHEMMGVTLDIVGRALFGSAMGDNANKVTRSLGAFYGLIDWVVALGPLGFIIPHPRTFLFLWNLFHLRRFVDKLIDQRRREEPQDDLLSMLVAAEEEGQKMSHSQVRAEALTLLLAGHETTAVALTWTWYLLSQNPECEARLHAELDSLLQGKPPTVEDLAKLDYTRRVLDESLRLKPPAYLIDRNPSQDINVHGYCIPKGSYVFVSPYATQRNPEFFPDPLKFDPDRWLPERIKERPLYSYFPFGVGPRACIGQSFALMEAMLVIATVASRWRFVLDPTQKIDTDPKITLRPRYGMRMTIHQR